MLLDMIRSIWKIFILEKGLNDWDKCCMIGEYERLFVQGFHEFDYGTVTKKLQINSWEFVCRLVLFSRNQRIFKRNK